MYQLFSFQLLIISCILLLLNFQANAFENISPKSAAQNKTNRFCEKKLMNGVRFYKIDSEGKKLKVRLRLAPFELSSAQQNGFTKFRAEYEKKYGAVYGANFFQRLLCRYHFGSYEYISLPVGVAEVDQLLRECPLKTLEHIVTNEYPMPDCAPGVIDCKKNHIEKSTHPLNKIACERIEK